MLRSHHIGFSTLPELCHRAHAILYMPFPLPAVSSLQLPPLTFSIHPFILQHSAQVSPPQGRPLNLPDLASPLSDPLRGWRATREVCTQQPYSLAGFSIELQSPLINCKLHEAARDFIFVGLFDHLTVLFVCSSLYPQCPRIGVWLEVST